MGRKSKLVKSVSKIPILTGSDALVALRQPTAGRRRQWKDREKFSKLPPPPPPAENLDDEFTQKTPTKPETPTTPSATSSNLSVLDAAAQVLADAAKPLNAGAIMEQMLSKGLWSTKGKTPAATLYSALIREIASKGKDSRFEKADKGHFILRKI